MKIFCGNCMSAKRLPTQVKGVSDSKKSEAFVSSAADTASTMIAMCSFIVVFQVIASITELVHINSLFGMLSQRLGLGDMGAYLIPCLTEVTGGSILSVKSGLPFTAFVVGFGGLSVHFQNFAICRDINLSKLLYIFIRFIQGLICSLLVSILLKIPYFSDMCEPASIILNDNSAVGFSRVSYGFGVMMIIMCFMSVICLPRNNKVNKGGEAC